MDLLGGYGSDDSGSSGEQTPARPPPPTADTTAASSKPQQNAKGKRIVSLHAVLPTHILDQLEKSTATGDFDSDDEEQVPTKPAATDSKPHAVTAKDEGLSSFLSELKSAPTSTVLGGGSGTKLDEKPAASQPLGHAFTTTTSVVVRRSGKDANDDVVDIHGAKPAPKAPPTVTTKKSTTAIPVAPRPATATVSVPRPSAGINRPVVHQAAPPPPQQAPLQQVPYYHPPEQQQQQQQDIQEESQMDDRRAKKRSRREMEKALREGNMAALDDNTANITTVEAEGSVYVPQEETYAVPRTGAVRNAAVKMYDTKSGTDVSQTEVTGKQRGKNQINTLLASAANLELQRARGMGGASVKNKRADAKRKYGW